MTEAKRHQPSLWTAVKKGIVDWYDKLGLMVAYNLLWTLPIASGVAISSALLPVVGIPLSVLAGFVFSFYGVSFIWTAACLSAQRTAEVEGPSLRDLADVWKTYRANWLRLCSLQCFISVVLMADFAFFMLQGTTAFRVAAVIVGYIGLLWMCSLLWQTSFLVLENSRPFAVIRKSVLVTLDNPLFTLGLLLVTILLSVVLISAVIPAVLVLSGVLACVLNRAHRELLYKYEIIVPEQDTVVDDGWPTSEEPPRRLNPRQQSRG